jgi:chorismate synthase
MQNTLGTILRLTTFGESHGAAIGGVLDGFPAGINIDHAFILDQLERRKPKLASFSTARREDDLVEFLSGIDNGISLGTPISFIVKNTNVRKADYNALSDVFRPSHADYTWFVKYGMPSGSGGGRSSARVMLPCVIGGALAMNLLRSSGIAVKAWVSEIGGVCLPSDIADPSSDSINESPVFCPDQASSENILKLLEQLAEEGDTCGGVVSCCISGLPAGLGEPVFGKLHASLAHALMGINSAKAISFGSGFSAASMKGSEYNDELSVSSGKVTTSTNHDGGVTGGISNGMDITLRLALKPIPSISRQQNTITSKLTKTTIKISGRHDTCAVPRSVPIVESLAALVIADAYLMNKSRTLL